MKNNKKDPWADAAYCHRKAEELQAQLAELSFAAVVAHAGVNLWRAEAAVLGKQKLSKSLYRKLKGAIGHYQAMEAARRLSRPKTEPLMPDTWDMPPGQTEAELEAERYAAYELAGVEDTRAVIVRFAPAEVELLQQLLPPGADVEACLRDHLLHTLAEDARRLLFCPQNGQRCEGIWGKSYVLETTGCRVAVELHGRQHSRLEQEAARAEMSMETLLYTLFMRPYREQYVCDPDADAASAEQDSYWETRAVRAEAELAVLRQSLVDLATGLHVATELPTQSPGRRRGRPASPKPPKNCPPAP